MWNNREHRAADAGRADRPLIEQAPEAVSSLRVCRSPVRLWVQGCIFIQAGLRRSLPKTSRPGVEGELAIISGFALADPTFEYPDTEPSRGTVQFFTGMTVSSSCV